MKEERNNFIDVLKGICIIFIVITHFTWSKQERLDYLFPFWIDMAVPVFMIISGYVNTLSFDKKKINCFSQAYNIKSVVSKMIRYTVPFFITYVIEVVYLFLVGRLSVSFEDIWSIVLSFFNGGKGQGSYYYPVMMQFIFVFPVIYFIVKKYKFKGVVICGFINAMFEFLQCAYGMNSECYRVLMFRYILVIAVGCYLAQNFFQFSWKAIITSIVGILFILETCYLGYKPLIIINWTRTSFMACLYIIPIAMLLLTKLNGVRFFPLEILGKASYNIFLTQMVYYRFCSEKVEEILQNRGLHLVINLIVCLCVGVIFYYAETPITKWINKKVRSSIDEFTGEC